MIPLKGLHPAVLHPAALKQPAPIPFGNQWVVRGEHITDLTWNAILTGLGAVLLLLGYGGFFPAQSGHLIFLGTALVLLNLTSLVVRWQRRQFGAPLLMLSRESYVPGDQIEVEFVREVRDGLKAPGGTMSFWLRCEEITMTVQGTDTSYEKVVLWEQRKQQEQRAGAHKLLAQLETVLPGNLPVNKVSTNHWILWKLDVRQELSGYRETSYYVLDVRAVPGKAENDRLSGMVARPEVYAE